MQIYLNGYILDILCRCKIRERRARIIKKKKINTEKHDFPAISPAAGMLFRKRSSSDLFQFSIVVSSITSQWLRQLSAIIRRIKDHHQRFERSRCRELADARNRSKRTTLRIPVECAMKFPRLHTHVHAHTRCLF